MINKDTRRYVDMFAIDWKYRSSLGNSWNCISFKSVKYSPGL